VRKPDEVAILQESPTLVKEKLPMLTDIVLDLRGPTLYTRAPTAAADWAEVGVKLHIRCVKLWSLPPKMGEFEGSHQTNETNAKLCQSEQHCLLTA